MADIFVVESKAKAEVVARCTGAPVVVMEGPVLTSLDPGGRGTPTGSGARLLADLARIPGTVWCCLEPGEPYDRWLASLVLADPELAGRCRLLRPACYTAAALAEARDRAQGLSEAMAHRLVRYRFGTHLLAHLRHLLGTTTGPQGLPLTPAALTVLLLLDNRRQELAMLGLSPAWAVEVEFAGGGRGQLAEVFADRRAAAARAAALEGAVLRLTAVDAAESFSLAPPGPHGLPSLCAEARRRLGLAPHRTLALCRRMVLGRDGAPPLLAVDPATGAVVPAAGTGDTASVPPPWQEEERELYQLVALRAQVREPVAGEACRVTLEGETGQGTVRLRWLAAGSPAPAALLYGAVAEPPRKGMTLSVAAARVAAGGTEAGGWHDLESLAGEMADFGLGVDGAWAAMLAEMEQRGYLEVDPAGVVLPRENCTKVARTLDRALPTMRGINLLAYLEQTIGEVVSGRKDLAFALKQFDQTMEKQGKVLVQPNLRELRQRHRRSAAVVKAPAAEEKLAGEQPPTPPAPPPADEGAAATPAAEPPVEERREVSAEDIRDDRASQEAAAREPTVDATGGPEPAPASEESAVEPAAATEEGTAEEATVFDTPATEEPAPTEEEAAVDVAAVLRSCPECGRPMVPGHDGTTTFWRCTAYPACRHQEREGEDGPAATAEPCPLCTVGTVERRQTPAGRLLYRCSQPGCQFMAWDRPRAEPCPVCGLPYLVEKKAPDGVFYLACPRAGCTYRQGEGAAAGGAPPPEPAVEATPAPAPAKKKRKVRVVRRRR